MESYGVVTELSGYKVSREQIQRIYTRYRFALDFSKDKEVLEVACGSGQGLGYLANFAKRVVGVDIDQNLLSIAEKQYQGRKNIELYKGDAQSLPFNDNSFDVIILYEAIYYLSQPEIFISEAKRVLRYNGIMLICSANRELPDFNPSPFSYKYFSACELYDLLNTSGFSNITILGDCPIDNKSFKARVLFYLKKTAVNLRLIPKTMKGKEFLKTIFFGKLITIPSEIHDSMAKYAPPVKINYREPDRLHKVIYSLAYNHR